MKKKFGKRSHALPPFSIFFPSASKLGDSLRSTKDCIFFVHPRGPIQVYDPSVITEPSTAGGSACYTFSSGPLAGFTPDARGLIRTCVKNAQSAKT